MTQIMQTDREPISEEEKLRLGELGGLEVDYFTLAGLTHREKEILHWRFVNGLPAGGLGNLSLIKTCFAGLMSWGSLLVKLSA